MAVPTVNNVQGSDLAIGDDFPVVENYTIGDEENVVLLMFAYAEGNVETYSVVPPTWDGVELTLLENTTFTGFSGQMWLYYLVNPTPGTQDISISSLPAVNTSSFQFYTCYVSGADLNDLVEDSGSDTTFPATEVILSTNEEDCLVLAMFGSRQQSGGFISGIDEILDTHSSTSVQTEFGKTEAESETVALSILGSDELQTSIAAIAINAAPTDAAEDLPAVVFGEVQHNYEAVLDAGQSHNAQLDQTQTQRGSIV